MASLHEISHRREDRASDQETAVTHISDVPEAKGGKVSPSVARLAVARGPSRRHSDHRICVRPAGFLTPAYLSLLRLVGVFLVLVLIHHYVRKYARCMRSLSASTSEGNGVKPNIPRRLATHPEYQEDYQVLNSEAGLTPSNAVCEAMIEEELAAAPESINCAAMRLEFHQWDVEATQSVHDETAAKRAVQTVRCTALLLAILTIIGLAIAFLRSVAPDSPADSASCRCTTGTHETSGGASASATTSPSVSTKAMELPTPQGVSYMIGLGVAAALSLMFASLYCVEEVCLSRKFKHRLSGNNSAVRPLGPKRPRVRFLKRTGGENGSGLMLQGDSDSTYTLVDED